MSAEAWAVVAVGVALAGLILRMSQRLDGLSGRVDGLARDVARLAERLARLEGIVEGWLNPPPPRPEAPK